MASTTTAVMSSDCYPVSFLGGTHEALGQPTGAIWKRPPECGIGGNNVRGTVTECSSTCWGKHSHILNSTARLFLQRVCYDSFEQLVLVGVVLPSGLLRGTF